MSARWSWPGARWWRFDLHVHSPASYDFKERSQQDWRRWLESARDAGIEAIAITDHNTAEGIEPLQRAQREVDGAPVLFPGVELTASDGVHLLFIFDPTCTRAHVEDLLSKASVPVERRGDTAARSEMSVESLLSLPCPDPLIIAAHVNGPDGLLKDRNGQQVICELRHPRLVAVEVKPDCPFDGTFIDGSRKDIQRKITPIHCSDAHSFGAIGRRSTWVKMTHPTIEGLRLALLDGEGSVGPAANGADPNVHADYVIESVEVSQAKYMGRKEPLVIAFNPWLNAIIGGRGTGKSTLIDLCRTTLRREHELGEPDEGSLRDAFERRMRVSGRGGEGLLSAGTKVRLVYRKDGERFAISWSAGGQATPIARLTETGEVAEEGDVRERFPVRIYSQKQLFALATEPNGLLQVIDDSEAVQAAELDRQRKEAEMRYLSLCAEARSFRAQASELPARRASLTDIRRKLQLLEQGGHADVLNDYRMRQTLDGTWRSIESAARARVDEIERAAEELTVADLDVNGDDEGSRALADAHRELADAVASLKQRVVTAIAETRARMAAVVKGQTISRWNEALATSEKRYEAVTAQLSGAGIVNPNEYRDFLLRAKALEEDIAGLEQRNKEADEREEQAKEALAQYRRIRQELSNRRSAFAKTASSDLVRVEIRPGALRTTLVPFVREVLGVDKFDDDIDALASAIWPDAQRWNSERIDGVVEQLSAVRGDPPGVWPARNWRFERRLRELDPERVDRLALYWPDDSVAVSFRDARQKNGQWRKLEQGSPGQQTAALLAFVLGYGREPIILDQPEDDLDTTLIYELVVRRLRETKAHRQIVVVTHNPNIVVHGDAELVLSLDARKGESCIHCQGGLQEEKVRDEVCRVMEGGREAFETRYRRIIYSHEANGG